MHSLLHTRPNYYYSYSCVHNTSLTSESLTNVLFIKYLQECPECKKDQRLDKYIVEALIFKQHNNTMRSSSVSDISYYPILSLEKKYRANNNETKIFRLQIQIHISAVPRRVCYDNVMRSKLLCLSFVF